MHAGKWTRRIITGLIVGVFATIAVSWCLELAVDPHSASARYRNWDFRDPLTKEEGHASESVTFGQRIVVVSYGQLMLGYPYDHDGPPPPWLPSARKPRDIWGQLHIGWPFYALKAGESPERDRPPLPTWTLTCFGQRLDLFIVPIWSGFLLDVVCYATAYTAIATSVAKLRRRRRPDLCLKCQYPLHGLPAGAPCPECGAAAALVS